MALYLHRVYTLATVFKAEPDRVQNMARSVRLEHVKGQVFLVAEVRSGEPTGYDERILLVAGI